MRGRKILSFRSLQRLRWLDGINGHEFEQTLADGEEKENLACYSPRGCKESDMTQ